ncbi:MAG: hypothetical protein K6V36_09665 [Anaerolineae bacterium]|nr:hypothetical protein [Anaerolineae bacterium]
MHGVLTATGDGLVVSLAGGERPHVGAVAVAAPYASPRHPGRTRASTSVLVLTGHRDDEVARPLAEYVARQTGQVAVVAVGLHVDDATPEEIAALTENARKALEGLLARLEASSEQPPAAGTDSTRPGREGEAS